jgi:predicted small lipoprotein YifL
MSIMHHTRTPASVLILTGCLALSLAGCGGEAPEALPPPASVYAPSPAATAPAMPAAPRSATAVPALPQPQHVPGNIKQLNDALAPYQGLDVGALTTKLGPPTEQQTWAGQLLMRWKKANESGLPCQLQAVVGVHHELLAGNWDGNDSGCRDLARYMQ